MVLIKLLFMVLIKMFILLFYGAYKKLFILLFYVAYKSYLFYGAPSSPRGPTQLYEAE